ncbi:MAG: hypothetical protein WCD86_10510 [Ktedonobacteraceae bacterium]
MSASRFFKRRQFLLLGGAGVAGFIGGGAVTAGVINAHVAASEPPSQGSPLAQSAKYSQIPGDGPYLHPGTFNQEFLAKVADVRQIWDFAALEQVQSDGFTPIKNAMNAFQFTYQKTLYPVICLRGSAVIYALDDALWAKYSLGTVYGQQPGGSDQNPMYHRLTTDNGTLSPENPNSLYQDSSLQALIQRGSYIAICHDALNGLAMQLAEQRTLTAQPVFKELATHLVPGATETPSGSSLIAVAQHLGFTYAKQ